MLVRLRILKDGVTGVGTARPDKEAVFACDVRTDMAFSLATILTSNQNVNESL